MPPPSWKRTRRKNPVGLGRNCALFESARTWAYREIRHHFGNPDGLGRAISSHALAATRERCQNWRDHVDQFLLGRAKWQEVLGEDTLNHRDAMWVRLKHPDSVWAKYPLHGNYDA